MDNIESLLFSLGIRATLKGNHFLWHALHLCLSNEDYLLNVYSILCEEVSKYYSTSKTNVHRCIHTAVESCWYKGNREFLIKIAGYHLKQRPANGEFIDILYHHLKSKKG